MQAEKFSLRAVVLAIVVFWVQAASAQGAANLDNATCLGCHGTPGFAAPRADGQTRALFVAPEHFTESVHGKASVRCVDCHTTITELPHKNVSKTAAEWDKTRHRDDEELHRLPCQSRAGLRRDLSRPGRRHGLRAWRNLRRLPWQSRRPARQQSGLDRFAGNLLKTCRKCHADATPGFATFQPHATTDDFAHYPYTWIASKFVNLAVGGVLLFFWAHSALWFYREYRDRQQQKPRPHVRADAVPQGERRYYQRWSAMWRWAHLLFAVSIILLVTTGITCSIRTRPGRRCSNARWADRKSPASCTASPPW